MVHLTTPDPTNHVGRVEQTLSTSVQGNAHSRIPTYDGTFTYCDTIQSSQCEDAQRANHKSIFTRIRNCFANLVAALTPKSLYNLLSKHCGSCFPARPPARGGGANVQVVVNQNNPANPGVGVVVNPPPGANNAGADRRPPANPGVGRANPPAGAAGNPANPPVVLNRYERAMQIARFDGIPIEGDGLLDVNRLSDMFRLLGQTHQRDDIQNNAPLLANIMNSLLINRDLVRQTLDLLNPVQTGEQLQVAMTAVGIAIHNQDLEQNAGLVADMLLLSAQDDERREAQQQAQAGANVRRPGNAGPAPRVGAAAGAFVPPLGDDDQLLLGAAMQGWLAGDEDDAGQADPAVQGDPAGVQVVVQQPDPAGVQVVVQQPDPAGVQVVVQQPDPAGAQVVVQQPDPAGVHVVVQQPDPAGVHVVVQQPDPVGVQVIVQQPDPAVQGGPAGVQVVVQQPDPLVVQGGPLLQVGNNPPAVPPRNNPGANNNVPGINQQG